MQSWHGRGALMTAALHRASTPGYSYHLHPHLLRPHLHSLPHCLSKGYRGKGEGMQWDEGATNARCYFLLHKRCLPQCYCLSHTPRPLLRSGLCMLWHECRSCACVLVRVCVCVFVCVFVWESIVFCAY